MKISLQVVIEKIKKLLSSINYQKKEEVIKSIEEHYRNNKEFEYFDTNDDDNASYQEIIDYFRIKYPNMEENKINSIIKHNEINYWCNSLFECTTNYEWRKEFMKDLEKLLNINIDLNEYQNNKNLDEFKYFLPICIKENDSYLWLGQGCLPIEWLCSLKLDKIISKGTHNQGKLNGPDMVFLNKFTKEKIGIEIAYLRKTHFTFNATGKDKTKYIDGIIKKSSVQKDIFQLANTIINDHTLQMSRYEKCNKYYLVLITESALRGKEYMFPLLEYYCDEYNKINCKNMWSHIYIF